MAMPFEKQTSDIMGEGVSNAMKAVAEKKSAESLFKKIDTNGNGFIEIDELVTACSDFGFFEEDVDKLLLLLDANCDGKVSWSGAS